VLATAFAAATFLACEQCCSDVYKALRLISEFVPVRYHRDLISQQ